MSLLPIYALAETTTEEHRSRADEMLGMKGSETTTQKDISGQVSVPLSQSATEAKGAGDIQSGVVVGGEYLFHKAYRYGYGLKGFDDEYRVRGSAGVVGGSAVGSLSLDILFPYDEGTPVGFQARPVSGVLRPQSGEFSAGGDYGAHFGAGQNHFAVFAQPFGLYGDRLHGSLGFRSGLRAEGAIAITPALAVDAAAQAGIVYAQSVQSENWDTVTTNGNQRTQVQTQDKIAQDGAGTSLIGSVGLALDVGKLLNQPNLPLYGRLDISAEDTHYKVIENAASGDVPHDYAVKNVTGAISAGYRFY